MDIQKIKELALANGFKLKEQADGSMDLNAYVYDFANSIEQAAKVESHKQAALYQFEINHFAKAQAVPEVLKKFCNEHKDPAWRGRLTEYDKGYSDCCIAVLEMIEAQEPAND